MSTRRYVARTERIWPPVWTPEKEPTTFAEKLQAAALVVVNSEDSLTTMTLPDPDARASVAALMVGASAGAALEAMAAGACGRAAGVLARLAYAAPELGDEDDG